MRQEATGLLHRRTVPKASECQGLPSDVMTQRMLVARAREMSQQAAMSPKVV